MVAQRLDSERLVAAWLEGRADLAAETIKHDRWALMLLVDAHAMLPTRTSDLLGMVQAQASYLGGRSQQTLWDRLRVFYSWASSQGYAVPDLPYIGFGRRRRGERRGRKRR